MSVSLSVPGRVDRVGPLHRTPFAIRSRPASSKTGTTFRPSIARPWLTSRFTWRQASLPAVARSAAGERPRWPHKQRLRGDGLESGREPAVQKGLDEILSRLAPGRFGCRPRKNAGQSVIRKPVDLEIYLQGPPVRPVIAVEVANVNTTQLVGETCRLYYDSCPLKLLVLGDRTVPPDGKAQCELLLARLYGQDSIANTPARVVWYHDDAAVAPALFELLLLPSGPERKTATGSAELGFPGVAVSAGDATSTPCPVCGERVTTATRRRHEVCEIREEDERRQGATPPAIEEPPPSWDNTVRRIEERR